VAREGALDLFGQEAAEGFKELKPFGRLCLPYKKMGAIDSVDLFGLDELILFSFYWSNRERYRRVADIGANIGLHSIMMSRCGYEVMCFEPDPRHFEWLKTNLELNDVSSVTPFNVAVGTKEGTAEFVRVLGNTTGSHLAGAKANPYGELERFPVKLVDFKSVLAKVDLIKMDVEGFEREILLSTTAADWKNTDLMVEVGTPENAQAVFDHFRGSVSLFAQKIGWKKVQKLTDMPTSYKEGTLFLTVKEGMPWGTANDQEV
jgi:FkbM family methyltransferase